MTFENQIRPTLRHWKQTALYVAQKPWVIIWWLRKHLAPDMPLPARLRWGGFWLAYNDFLGSHTFCGTGFEDNEQQVLLNFLKPGMTVVDIGAHHGFYTLLALSKIGHTGKVIAFEPSPRELDKLKLHLSLNKCTNVTVVPFALGEQPGKVEMFVCLSHSGLNSLRKPNADTPVAKVAIDQIRLDDYVKDNNIDKIDLIKMDVEGGELAVLKGANEIVLSKLRPIILYEIQDIRSTPWGYKAKELYQYLKQHNYQSYYITNGGKIFPCQDKEEFDDNLLAVPIEKADLVKNLLADAS